MRYMRQLELVRFNDQRLGWELIWYNHNSDFAQLHLISVFLFFWMSTFACIKLNQFVLLPIRRYTYETPWTLSLWQTLGFNLIFCFQSNGEQISRPTRILCPAGLHPLHGLNQDARFLHPSLERNESIVRRFNFNLEFRLFNTAVAVKR